MVCAVSVCSLLGLPAHTSAEGITVTPIFQELMLTSLTQIESASFSVTNQGETPQTYRLRAVNIEAADTSGGIILSGLSADFEAKHGLSQWLQFDQQTVTIGPKESKEIPFKIVNNASLRPGGHYGALIAQSITNAEAESANKVALSPQAASLVFVKKIGGEQYGLSLRSFRIPSGLIGVPQSATIVLENSGDIHVVPRGSVVVRDMQGTEVARGAVNTDSALILPTKVRELAVELRQVSGGLRWPGRYTASINYRFEGKESEETVTYTFWFFNAPLSIGLIIALGFLLWLSMRFRTKIWHTIIIIKKYIVSIYKKVLRKIKL
jgi:hypothetical protein